MSDEMKQPLKPALKYFYEKQSLSNAQLDSLNEMLKQQTKRNPLMSFKWPGAMAASILLFVVMLSFFHTPALITSAYADIYKDANLNNGMQASMQQWLSVNNVSAVPQEYPVKMSKFCRLGAIVTTHLRIAGKQQGEMNVFIQQGDSGGVWMDRAGSVDDINWKLIKVRDDLTLVVLYTQNMREKAVQHILSEMLPELRV